MNKIKELADAVLEARRMFFMNAGPRVDEPTMVAYVESGYFDDMVREIPRSGKVPYHVFEMANDWTICGVPVYRVVTPPGREGTRTPPPYHVAVLAPSTADC